jgi:hypothetical protein
MVNHRVGRRSEAYACVTEPNDRSGRWARSDVAPAHGFPGRRATRKPDSARRTWGADRQPSVVVRPENEVDPADDVDPRQVGPRLHEQRLVVVIQLPHEVAEAAQHPRHRLADVLVPPSSKLSDVNCASSGTSPIACGQWLLTRTNSMSLTTS